MKNQIYKSIPKKIFSFWMQGASVAPEIVQFNWDRWLRLNPDFEIIILDMNSSKEIMAWIPFDLNTIPRQTYSDILRYHLLQKFGGIWVDATVFPTVPLKDWLPEAISGANFFAFSFPDIPNNRLLLDNWFIASNKNSIIINSLFDNTIKYWSNSRVIFDNENKFSIDQYSLFKETLNNRKFNDRHQYFWSHHLFNYLVEKDSDFKEEWSMMNKYSANVPVEMQWYFLRNESIIRSILLKNTPILNKYMIKFYANKSPVHKLDWRRKYPIEIMSQI